MDLDKIDGLNDKTVFASPFTAVKALNLIQRQLIDCQEVEKEVCKTFLVSALGVVKLCGYTPSELLPAKAPDAKKAEAPVETKKEEPKPKTEAKPEPVKEKSAEKKAEAPAVKPSEAKTEPVVADAPVSDAKVVSEESYEAKHGYAPDGTIKTVIGVIWDGEVAVEKVEQEAKSDLDMAIKKMKLDAKVAFNQTTGNVGNEMLPKTFMNSTFKKSPDGKLTLRLRGYVAASEEKALGTDKVMVKVFDAVVLNKMKDKEKTIAMFDGVEMSVAQLLTECSIFFIGQNDSPIGAIAIYEKAK